MRNFGRPFPWLRQSLRQVIVSERVRSRRGALGFWLVVAALGPLLGGCAQKSPLSKRLAKPAAIHSAPIQSASIQPLRTQTSRARRLPLRSPPRRSPARSASRYDRRTGVYASERLVLDSRAVPKGGGNYKLGKPYQVSGVWYAPKLEPNYIRSGTASWYGDKFHGRRTANGETYDMRALSAAHPTMPLPSYAYVTNLSNGRTVMVRVNDRGPFVRGRIIDLSRAAANALNFKGQGVAKVQVRYAGRAPLNGSDRRERAFLRQQSWARTLQLTPRPAGASGLIRARSYGTRRRITRRGASPSAKSNSRVPSWAWRPRTNYLARQR